MVYLFATSSAESLQDIATTYLATDAIQNSKRLIVTETQHKSDVSYRAILKKKSAPTLAFLYDVFTNTKDEHSNATVKVDRNVLQRLFIII